VTAVNGDIAPTVRLLKGTTNEPPHDLGAEAAVVSAVILDKGAIDLVEDILTADHFFSESHQRIYLAVQAVRDAGRPVDVVTVATWLRDRDRLAQVGGMAYMTEVLNAAPAVVNVRAYAEIVVDKAMARKLIAMCQKYVAIGYGDYGSAVEYVGDVARDVNEIAMSSDRSTSSPIGAIIADNVRAALAVANSSTGLMGLSTGLDRYDRMTSGLRKGELTIVAARPGMGKTSLVLQMAIAAARTEPADGRRSYVGFFSLEMPREQIGARALCCLGKVDVSRFRTGLLSPTDWTKLNEAASILHDLPLHVDDQASMSIVQFRAKARRMKTAAELDGDELALIAVDYLQLMNGSGEQSREQEISMISRGLKQLAKELEIPIIALSQLNRAVETRGEKKKRPLLSDLRECIAGDQIVVDAMTGDRVTMREIAAGRPTTVFGLGTDLKIRCAPVAEAWSTGVKPILKVTTASGRTLRCTANHPVRTIHGWTRIEDLAPGDRLAAPRETGGPIVAENPLAPDELRLLGYLICDGHYGRHRSVGYVKGDSVLVADVRRIAFELFGISAKEHRCQGIAEQVELTAPRTGPGGNPLIEWLKKLGIHGQIKTAKRCPPSVFRCDNRMLGIFLGHLWAGDGSVVPKRGGAGWVLKFTSTSMGLLDEVHGMLTRLGVVAARGKRERNSKSTVDISTISIAEADAILRFADVVEMPGIKGEKLKMAVVWCMQAGRNARLDRLPIEVTSQVEEAKQAAGMSWRDLGYRCQGKEMCRQDLDRVAGRLARTDFAELSDSDVLWDAVDTIIPDGEAETFDLRVPGLGNFVVGNVFAHNSGAIEQDADNICFIYRDDYYDKDSSDRGVAELIIAKQRNGPTDTVKVRFDAQYTRFDNLPDGDGYDSESRYP
jgi:replicative DNA helicase